MCCPASHNTTATTALLIPYFSSHLPIHNPVAGP
jgi:hypothetical protein